MGRAGAAVVWAAALWLGATGRAFASDDALRVGPCTEAAPDVEAADQALVMRVTATMRQKGPQAVAQDLPSLAAVLQHHRSMQRIEQCGETIRVNSGDPQDALYAQAAMVGTVTKANASSTSIDAGRSYVVGAAYLAGFLAADRGEYERAISYLRQGLSVSPYYPPLVSEAANVLALAGRLTEAVAVIDEALAHEPNDDLTPDWRGALLRRKGFALGELSLWDEAKAAYEQSLKWAPNAPNALNELNYIAQRKAGGASAAAHQVTTSVQTGVAPPK